jgi:hypothetical protein
MRIQCVLTPYEQVSIERFKSYDLKVEIDMSVFGKKVPWKKLSGIMKNNQCREVI